MRPLLGRPGTTLTELPSPKPGVDRSPDAHTNVQELLGGGYSVDRAPRACRTWDFAWSWDPTAWQVLSAFYRRQRGPGPFVLLDPAQVNYLTPNQASGSETYRDTTGFDIDPSSSETIASSADVAYRDERSLRWVLPAAVSSGNLALLAPGTLLGYPVQPGQPWSLSGRFRTGGTDSTFDIRARLQWLDKLGAVVSTSDGTYTAQTSAAWTLVSTTASAPATAVYVLPLFQADPADITGGMTDTFTRTVAAGSWNTADTGQSYTVSGTASEWSVASATGGRMALVSINDLHIGFADAGSPDVEVTGTPTLAVVPTGAPITLRVAGRLTDVSNYYEAQISVAVTGITTLFITKRVAGTGSTVLAGPVVGTHSAGNQWAIKLRCEGTTLKAKAWKTTDVEPDWQATAADSSLTTGNSVAALARRETGNLNGTQNVDWRSLIAVSTYAATAYLGEAQLQVGAVTAWRPGEGPALVSMTSLKEVAQIATTDDQRRDVQATFVEVTEGG